MLAVAYAETPSRPRRIYQASWKFRIGSAVKCGELSAIVLDRRRSAKGRETYDLWVMGRAYGQPYRVVAGGVLN